jgi:hypothetical protein
LRRRRCEIASRLPPDAGDRQSAEPRRFKKPRAGAQTPLSGAFYNEIGHNLPMSD